MARVNALPGVDAAGVVRALPLATAINEYSIDVDGYEESPGRETKGEWQVVSAGAFEAMGMRLLRGRWFSGSDAPAGVPVAVVNETMARKYWTDPAAVLGGRIRLGSQTDRPWATVVGVVADEHQGTVTDLVREKFYIPHNQRPSRCAACSWWHARRETPWGSRLPSVTRSEKWIQACQWPTCD
jgi:hypothetical protein